MIRAGLAVPALLALTLVACTGGGKAEKAGNEDPAEAGAAAIEQKAKDTVEAQIREIEARAAAEAQAVPASSAEPGTPETDPVTQDTSAAPSSKRGSSSDKMTPRQPDIRRH